MYNGTFACEHIQCGIFYDFLLYTCQKILLNNLFFRIIELEIYKMLRDHSEFKPKSKEAD